MILSVALMLEYTFQNSDAARDIFHAVKMGIELGYRTPDIAPGGGNTVSTVEMGNAVCECLLRK